MKITEHKIKVKDLFEGYRDSGIEGVVAYGGRLDVRPAYQREFVYKDKQRDAVIDTLLKGYPLNVMYWAKTGEDRYEVLDGQQRTISICQYMNHDFGIKDDGRIMYIDNWTEDVREIIDNYELMVYVCEGGDAEKLDWFKTINIAGEEQNSSRTFIIMGPCNIIEKQEIIVQSGAIFYNGYNPNENKEGIEEEAFVDELSSFFYGDKANARKFLCRIRNAKPTDVTSCVNQLLHEGVLSSMTCYKPLWEVLSRHGLYEKSYSNWASQVKKYSKLDRK